MVLNTRGRDSPPAARSTSAFSLSVGREEVWDCVLHEAFWQGMPSLDKAECKVSKAVFPFEP